MRTDGDNMLGLKRQNRAAVLLRLHRHGGLSRKRLASMLGLTPAAVTKIAAELIEEGLVFEDGPLASTGVGRREILLRLNPNAFCSLGVSIGLGIAVDECSIEGLLEPQSAHT